MPEIITQPIDPLRALDAQGTDRFKASMGEVLAATAEDAWTRSAGPSLYRWAGRELRGIGGAPAMLAPEDANREYGIDGHLRFDEQVSKADAADLRALKLAELRRQDAMRRGQGGMIEGAAKIGVGLVATIVDPLNIAASFVPVVGQARYAAMLDAAASYAGRAGVRAAVGAAEGAAGAALLEPIVYGVARQEQADYSAVDSLTNLAFGSVIGGGLHVAGGAVGDWRQGWKPPGQVAAEAAGHPGRETAMRQAVAAVAEDRTPDEGVQVALQVNTPQSARRPWASRSRSANPVQDVFDASGRRVRTRMELVEADQLVTSNTDDLNINPAYPAELQPRQRDRVVSQTQIADIAANLEPARLGASPDAASGAPIIDGNRIVESGNGRVLALRRAYADGGDRATAYRAWLEEQGYPTAGMQRPVLVRRRLTDLSPEERRQFTVDAQKSGTLDLSASERAATDARLLDDLLPMMQGNDIGAVGNAPFVRAFIDRLPAGDRGSLVNADAMLTPEGHRRINAAMLARAFDDKDLLARMLEGGEDGGRTLAGAMLDIAPDWARMRAAAARGDIAPVDPTADLVAAIKRIRDQRAQGRPLAEILDQADFLDRRSPGTDLFLNMLLTRNKAGETTLASRPALVRELGRFIEEANKSSPTPDLFGGEPPTADQILEALARRRDVLPGIADDTDARVMVEAQALDGAKPAQPEALDAEIAALDAEIKAAKAAGIADIENAADITEAKAMAEEAATRAREIEAATFCLMRAA